MTAKKTARQQAIELVLDRIKQQCADDSDYREMYMIELDKMLDDLHGQDAFGTEGQSDPRGDFRNGEWSIMKPEGFKVDHSL